MRCPPLPLAANNQWNVEGELSDDPAQSSFRKALELAEGTVSILDRNGVVFSRVWCCYEIYVSLAEMGGRLKYEVYTAHKHEYDAQSYGGEEESLAVGFTDGPTEADGSSVYKSNREKHFPLELATRSFGTELQKAEASMPADRTRILNTIAGRTGAELQLPAEAAHPSYDRLNAVLRGRFAASALRQLIEQGEPLGPCLAALKLSEMPKLPLTLNFPEETAEALGAQIFGSLPAELEELDLSGSKLQRGGVIALAAALPTTNIRVLRCARCCALEHIFTPTSRSAHFKAR